MVSEKWKMWLWKPLGAVIAVFALTPWVQWILNQIGILGQLTFLTSMGLDKWIIAFFLVLLMNWLVEKKWK